MIGIAWQVGENESLDEASLLVAHRHKKEFSCWPDCIMVDPITAKSLVVKGLTVIGSQFIGKSYTFLLYHKER